MTEATNFFSSFFTFSDPEIYGTVLFDLIFPMFLLITVVKLYKRAVNKV